MVLSSQIMLMNNTTDSTSEAMTGTTTHTTSWVTSTSTICQATLKDPASGNLTTEIKNKLRLAMVTITMEAT